MTPAQRRQVSRIELALNLCSKYLKITEIFAALLLFVYISDFIKDPLMPNEIVAFPLILCLTTNIITRCLLNESQPFIIDKIRAAADGRT